MLSVQNTIQQKLCQQTDIFQAPPTCCQTEPGVIKRTYLLCYRFQNTFYRLCVKHRHFHTCDDLFHYCKVFLLRLNNSKFRQHSLSQLRFRASSKIHQQFRIRRKFSSNQSNKCLLYPNLVVQQSLNVTNIVLIAFWLVKH